VNDDRFEPIPSHFFETGPYEVWSWQNIGTSPYQYGMVKIADGLCLATALAYDWPKKEIRINGITLTDAEIAEERAKLRKK